MAEPKAYNKGNGKAAQEKQGQQRSFAKPEQLILEADE
jgi:hypothetical protein